MNKIIKKLILYILIVIIIILVLLFINSKLNFKEECSYNSDNTKIIYKYDYNGIIFSKLNKIESIYTYDKNNSDLYKIVSNKEEQVRSIKGGMNEFSFTKEEHDNDIIISTSINLNNKNEKKYIEADNTYLMYKGKSKIDIKEFIKQLKNSGFECTKEEK